MTQPEATIIAGLCTLCAGVVSACIVAIGWVVVHRTTLTREREARTEAARIARDERMRVLEGFLAEKEHIVEAASQEAVYNEYFGREGLLNAGRFRKEVAAVRRDISPDQRITFDGLDDALGRLEPSIILSEGREKIAKAIRALHAFIKKS